MVPIPPIELYLVAQISTTGILGLLPLSVRRTLSMQDAFYQQGIEKAQRKDYQGAIAAFDQALHLAPEFAAAYHQRGLAYFHLNAFAAAISDYSQALQLEPDNASLHFGRALVHLATGDLPAALQDASQAIRLNPEYAAAYSLRGTTCQRLG